MTKIILFLLAFFLLSNYNFISFAKEVESNISDESAIQTVQTDKAPDDEKSGDNSTANDPSSNGSSSQTGNQVASSENPTKIDIKVSNIVAKINPQTEITLPAGSFSEHFKHRFNNLNIIFNFNYNFLANELSGNITFQYPLKYILPYFTFSDSVDFESYIQPSLVDNKIQLIPTDKFITRDRTFESGLKYMITKKFNAFTSFNLDDLFRGDLSTATIIESGLDLTAKIGTEYNSMRVMFPNSKLLFKGIYYKDSVNLKYRNNFNNPVSLDHNANFLLSAKIGRNWYIDQGINLGFPLKVWKNTLASFYTLGGFDSLRGYQEKSINAFRYISTSSTLHKRITLKKEIKKKILKNYYIHARMFDLYLFYDQCLAQNQLQLDSPISFFPSVGIGSSIIISGENKKHLKVSLFIGQALQKGKKPIIYLKSSFFQFEK